jgi:hypothetical protein
MRSDRTTWRRARTLCAGSVLLTLGACSYHSKSLDAPPPQAPGAFYEVIKSVTVRRSGVRVLYIPVSLPSARSIVAEQVALAGGDGAVNVEVTFSEALYFFPVSIPSVEVRCDIIRYTDAAVRPKTQPVEEKKKEREGLLDR